MRRAKAPHQNFALWPHRPLALVHAPVGSISAPNLLGSVPVAGVVGQLLVVIDRYRRHHRSRWSGWIAAAGRAIMSASESSPDGLAYEIRLNTSSIRR